MATYCSKPVWSPDRDHHIPWQMKKPPRPAINPEHQAQFLQLMKAAADVTWRKPDVEVLRQDLIDQYPSIVRGLQNAIRIGHERGKLLLPDLEAFGNETVAIFSDYGGESGGDYHTYGFLACAWNTRSCPTEWCSFGGVAASISGQAGIDQAAMDGSVTAGSSLSCVTLSSVM